MELLENRKRVSMVCRRNACVGDAKCKKPVETREKRSKETQKKSWTKPRFPHLTREIWCVVSSECGQWRSSWRKRSCWLARWSSGRATWHMSCDLQPNKMIKFQKHQDENGGNFLKGHLKRLERVGWAVRGNFHLRCCRRVNGCHLICQLLAGSSFLLTGQLIGHFQKIQQATRM